MPGMKRQILRLAANTARCLSQVMGAAASQSHRAASPLAVPVRHSTGFDVTGPGTAADWRIAHFQFQQGLPT
jgi:hypothetical protein